MRQIGWLLLILLGVGWWASEMPLAETQPDNRDTTGWRRTAHGWQHSSRWTLQKNVHRPALHPSVVGLLEMFLASAALIGLAEQKSAPPRTRGTRIPDEP